MGHTSGLQLLAAHIEERRPSALVVFLQAHRVSIGGGEDFCVPTEVVWTKLAEHLIQHRSVPAHYHHNV